MKQITIPFKSNILTKNGYLNVESLTLKKKLTLENAPINFKVLDKNNKQITTTYLFFEDKNIYKVKTLTGNIFYITEDTNLLCLTMEGKVINKTIREILPTDEIISKVGDNISDSKELLTEEDAYLLGYFYSINFSELIKTQDEKIYIPTNNSTFENIRDIIINKFDVCCEEKKLYIYNSNININNYILQYNFNKNQIPDLIKESNINIQTSFVQGFYDVFTILEKNTIKKEINNDFFYNDLLLLLKNLGIIAEKNTEFIIRGEEIINYYNLIGFSNVDYENKMLTFNLSKEDFYIINSLKKITQEFYKTVSNKKIELTEDFEYTRNNIENLLTLDGDEDLKNIIRPLIQENICYDRIDTIEILANQKCIVLEINSEDTIIIDSLII